MTWLFITIGAYLLFSLGNIGDKLVVSKFKTEPIVYAFYVGIMGAATFILIPFGVIIPDTIQIGWSFLGGFAFVVALYFMYKAIVSGETTRAITIMGGTAPFFTLIFSYFFLDERLAYNQLAAFFILVLAIIVISWDFSKKGINKKQIFWAVFSGMAFAASYVLAKYVYLYQPFISGFVWIRVGGFLAALIIFLLPTNRKLIKIDWARPKKKKGGLILGIQLVGGLGVIGQNYAFSLASATLINALQAIQYAGVFVLSTLLGKKMPQLKESLDARQIIQKIIAIVLIASGLYFLALI